jgi:hypothetical protein
MNNVTCYAIVGWFNRKFSVKMIGGIFLHLRDKEYKVIVYTKNKHSCVNQIRTIIIHYHIWKGKLKLIMKYMIDQDVHGLVFLNSIWFYDVVTSLYLELSS